MKLKKIAIKVLTLFIISFTLLISAGTVDCFPVYGFSDGGDPFCGIACTDGTIYFMDCGADIFQDDTQHTE